MGYGTASLCESATARERIGATHAWYHNAYSWYSHENGASAAAVSSRAGHRRARRDLGCLPELDRAFIIQVWRDATDDWGRVAPPGALLSIGSPL